MAYHPLIQIQALGYLVGFPEDSADMVVGDLGRHMTEEDAKTVRDLYPKRRQHLVTLKEGVIVVR